MTPDQKTGMAADWSIDLFSEQDRREFAAQYLSEHPAAFYGQVIDALNEAADAIGLCGTYTSVAAVVQQFEERRPAGEHQLRCLPPHDTNGSAVWITGGPSTALDTPQTRSA